MGIDMSETIIKNSKFLESNFQFSNFDRTKFTDIVFEKINFSDVSISEAKIKRWTTEQCQFIKNNFFNKNLPMKKELHKSSSFFWINELVCKDY